MGELQHCLIMVPKLPLFIREMRFLCTDLRSDGFREPIVDTDLGGGCMLCDVKDFQREGFTDLTVILCDQCEREFHVGCLREHGRADLTGLPQGTSLPGSFT